MVDPKPEDTEEKPLDPAVARVQARLQRLMLIAGLTLGLGILAVFLAIIYRITASDDKIPVAIHNEPAGAAAAATTVAQAEEEVAKDAAPEPEPAAQPEPAPDPEPTPAPEPAEPAAQAEVPEPASAAPADAAPIPVPSPRLPPVGGEAATETGRVPPETDAAVLATKASVPADARLVASTVAGGRIVLTYEHFNGTILLVVDPETLKVVGRLDVEPQ